MPGRQAHGRPLLPSTSSRNNQKKKKKQPRPRANGLDAFALASKQVPASYKGMRTRDLDPEPDHHKKRRHDDEEDGDGDGGDDDAGGGPGRAQAKRPRRDADGAGGSGDSEADEDDEMQSDSEGNEWHVGVGEDDDDSEIDSDEAFGESDEERFEGFALRGSSSNSAKKRGRKAARGGEEEEEEEEEDDDDSLGEDAIDLAQALDQVSDDDDDEEGSSGDSESGSEEEEDSDSESPATDDEEEDEDEDEVDGPSRLDALQNLASAFADDVPGDSGDETAKRQQSKVDLEDLGLVGVKDPIIKKSLKLLRKEDKAAKPGASKKLGVPLARRQQEQLLRIAAAEKAHQSLDKWTDTVKHNRRAEHLVFPLPQSLPSAGLDKGQLLPLSTKNAASELEQTIMSIMEESGLGPGSKPKPEEQPGADAEGDPAVSRKELKEIWSQRRRDREIQSREQARAKRIKKIKSKAYRRVHRKEKARMDAALAEEEELEEGGGADSEEEREAQHRRRAMERMGARHRESKWAKMAKNTGRAAWDDDFRTGLLDMARRDEELRRRVEGRAGGESGGEDGSDASEDDGADSDPEKARRRILQELRQVATDGDDGEPQSNLMKMAFMQRAEKAQKLANDETIAQIMRDLASDGEDAGEDGSDEEVTEVGRRKYGVPNAGATVPQRAKQVPRESASSLPKPSQQEAILFELDQSTSGQAPVGAWAESTSAGASGGAWSSGAASKTEKGGRGAKKHSRAAVEVANLEEAIAVVIAKPKADKPEAAKPSSSLPSKPDAKLSSKPSSSSKSAKASKPTSSSSSLLPNPKPLATGSDTSSDEDSDGDENDEGGAAAQASSRGRDRAAVKLRDAALFARALGEDDEIETSFSRDKTQAEEDDGDRVVEAGLPGWGSWVGEGVGKRQRRNDARARERMRTVVKGVGKADRKDARLERVIISEKRVKKNDKYLASQLPHEFENRHQYERSLRLPLGPEWSTKEAFQEATKPRVIVKQGVIAPMAKPLLR